MAVTSRATVVHRIRLIGGLHNFFQALLSAPTPGAHSASSPPLRATHARHAQAAPAAAHLPRLNDRLTQARQAAQSTQRQYDQGAADIVQLNQSLSSLQQAQLELAKSQTDFMIPTEIFPRQNLR